MPRMKNEEIFEKLLELIKTWPKTLERYNEIKPKMELIETLACAYTPLGLMCFHRPPKTAEELAVMEYVDGHKDCFVDLGPMQFPVRDMLITMPRLAVFWDKKEQLDRKFLQRMADLRRFRDPLLRPIEEIRTGTALAVGLSDRPPLDL